MNAEINKQVAEAIGDDGSPYWMMSSDGGKSYSDICEDRWQLPEFKEYYQRRKERGMGRGAELVEAVRYNDYAGDLNLAMEAARKLLKVYNPVDCVSLHVFYDNSATCEIRYTENDIVCRVEASSETPALALCNAIIAASGQEQPRRQHRSP